MAKLTFTNSNTDVLIGGDGNDFFTLNDLVANLSTADRALGGGGIDTLAVNVTGALSDNLFLGLSSIEELVFSKAAAPVDLTAGFRFGEAGLTHIDARLVSGLVTVNASADQAGWLVIDG